MSRWGLGLLVAAAFAAASASAQSAPEGLRDTIGAAPRPRTWWTPSAFRAALLDQPIAPGSLPRGFGVLRVEARTPTPDERAAGMAYRVDVLLSGPYRAQAISYRMYDTPEAALSAAADKTLGDRSVTLTRESVDGDLTYTYADGASYPCARVYSASFSGVVFMRCHGVVANMPLIAGAAVGFSDDANASGEPKTEDIEKEEKTASDLLTVGLGQIQALMAADPNGLKAYLRDAVRGAPRETPSPPHGRR